MKHTNKFLVGSLIALSGLLTVSVTKPVAEVVGAKAATNVLRIYSWEDYIYEDEKTGESLIDMFIDDYKAKHPGENIEVLYTTFATNEEMYNSLTLGETYDLLVPSDYMIQRLIQENRIQKIDTSRIPNYTTYASPKLQKLFEDNGWDEYAAGYMWGTMGILYNSENVDYEDTKSWGILWDEKYNKEIAIKDSMREGYIIGLLRVYYDELMDLKDQYEANELTTDEYNAHISDILNRTDSETIALVGEALKQLKSNYFGLEVDQGKNDMVSGKININTAWSGDAVYAIYQAAEAGKDVLRYTVPEEGSNIWYDAFVMPNGANADLAYEFIDFVSTPEYAARNIEYIGYTSFIAGDSILEYVLSYDEVVDENFEGETIEVDLTYFFEGTLEEYAIEDAVFLIDAESRGGQLTTQYPSVEEINRSAVMRNFSPEANKAVTDMWADFRASELQAWMFIVGGAVLVIAIGLGVFFFLKKKKSSRTKRRAKR